MKRRSGFYVLVTRSRSRRTGVFAIRPVYFVAVMYGKVVLQVITSLAVLQSLPKLELSALACIEDFDCVQNSSVRIICCSGACEQWLNCPGACISDDTCDGGNICFNNRCANPDISFPAFCNTDRDCLEEEECESGQCKPAPRPVEPVTSGDVQVSFDFDRRIFIIIGAVFGSLIFVAVVGYGSYRCFKQRRRRRFSRGVYSASARSDHGVNLFSPRRNGVETFTLNRTRPTLHVSAGFSYPQRPPPEYDAVTLDSNLDVESSSPPPYDQVGETVSRSSDEAQVCYQ